MSSRILVVDDDAALVRLVEFELGKAGYETASCGTAARGLELVEEDPPACVLLDISLPDGSGKDVLEKLAKTRPEVPIVMLTARTDVAEVVQCMRLGAADYVQKPHDPMRLLTSVTNACQRGALKSRVTSIARELKATSGLACIIGESPAIGRAKELIGRAAQSDVTVLLTGESGTGKEVAARAVHAEGARAEMPFIAVNCGAIPENLIESELFGHEKGAYTGAVRSRIGLFEQADKGTLFLDEVGELRLDLQVKLLRALQERVIERIGGGRPRKIDVRVVAATNRDLKADQARGAFREDLYYRLAVFPIKLPPLRDRQGDVVLLAKAFLGRFSRRHGRSTPPELTAEATQALAAYAWPGNVRELENVIERALVLEEGQRITLGSLPEEVLAKYDPGRATHAPAPAAPPGTAPTAGDDAVIRPLEDEERRLIRRALEITAWNVTEAAERLQIGRATIYRKIERYGLRAGGA
jgi:DNA-binding NtrC family response regulator